MKCEKCGNDLNQDDKFCTSCGQAVNVDTKKYEVKEEKTEEKRIIKGLSNDYFFCILSLLFYFGGSFLSRILNSFKDYSSIFEILSKILGLSPFIGLGLVIYAKVKYPKSTFAKTLLIIYIVLFAVALIYLIIVLIACGLAIKGFSDLLTDCGNSNFVGFLFN